MAFTTPLRNPFGTSFGEQARSKYLLFDDFLTADPAPLVTPRTCEPGPGQMIVNDPSGVLSISSGSLRGTTAVTASGYPSYYSEEPVAPVQGLALDLRVGYSGGSLGFWWGFSNTPTATYPTLGNLFFAGKHYPFLLGYVLSIDSPLFTAVYQPAVILLEHGAIFLRRYVPTGQWISLGIAPCFPLQTNELYFRAAKYGNSPYTSYAEINYIRTLIVPPTLSSL